MRKLEKSELKRVYGAGGPGGHRHLTDHPTAHNHGRGQGDGATGETTHSDGVHGVS